MSFIIQFLIWTVILIAIFLIFRVVVLWYWKIDKIVKLLEEIVGNLKGKPKEEENNKDLGRS
jgi:predicted tellurium resistance membrane protein TerC